jgi:hypothetical protein
MATCHGISVDDLGPFGVDIERGVLNEHYAGQSHPALPGEKMERTKVAGHRRHLAHHPEPLPAGMVAQFGTLDIVPRYRLPFRNGPHGRTKRSRPPAALAISRSKRTRPASTRTRPASGMRPAIHAGARGPYPRLDGVGV